MHSSHATVFQSKPTVKTTSSLSGLETIIPKAFSGKAFNISVRPPREAFSMCVLLTGLSSGCHLKTLMSFHRKRVSKDMSCMLKGHVPLTLSLGYEKVIKEKVSMADV